MTLIEPPEHVRRPPETAPAAGWITIPARIIALTIVVPVRAGYDLVTVLGRGSMAVLRRVGRSPRALMRILRAVGRWIRTTFLAPSARALASVATAVWSAVRWFGSGLGHLLDRVLLQPARLLHHTVLAPIGHVLMTVGRAIGCGAAFVAGGAWGAIRRLGSGIAWLLGWTLVRPLRLLGAGTLWLFSMIGRVGAAAIRHVIVLPAVFVWRYVLHPPLAGAAWLARALGTALAPVGHLLWNGVSSTFLGVLAALGWAWHSASRLLRLLFRRLILVPADLLWRHALRPVWQAVAWAWRMFVGDPARWVRNRLLRPARLAVGRAWQVSVREPLRQARLTVRATLTETRRQIRTQFLGAFRRTR